MTGYDIQFMNLVALTMSLAKQRLAKDLELDFCPQGLYNLLCTW